MLYAQKFCICHWPFFLCNDNYLISWVIFQRNNQNTSHHPTHLPHVSSFVSFSYSDSMNNSVLVSIRVCRSYSLYFCLVQAQNNSVLFNYLPSLIPVMSLVHYSQMAIFTLEVLTQIYMDTCIVEKSPWMILVSGTSFPQPPYPVRTLFFMIYMFFLMVLNFLKSISFF